MADKNLGALILGLALVIFTVVYILPIAGIDIPNPFQPTITATVSIGSTCIANICDFNIGTTTVTFETGRPLKIVAPPLEIYASPCYGPFGVRLFGYDAIVKFKVPASGYQQSKAILLCGNVIDTSFTFNKIAGIECYIWELDVLNAQTGGKVFTKTGTECFGG